MITKPIRVIVFDAVGTLIHPHPPAIDIYAAVGHSFGSRLDAAAIKQRFRAAFRRQEDYDKAQGYRTDHDREVLRWRTIVGEVLDDVTAGEPCFQALFAHFAQPDSWRCAPETDPVLAQLLERGYRLGLASNFDKRLHAVVNGLPQLKNLRHRIVSAEVGVRKPAKVFFDNVCATVEAAPEQILVVGDDLANDYEGAVAAGLSAVLYDPAGNQRDVMTLRIGGLHELLTLLPGVDL